MHPSDIFEAHTPRGPAVTTVAGTAVVIQIDTLPLLLELTLRLERTNKCPV